MRPARQRRAKFKLRTTSPATKRANGHSRHLLALTTNGLPLSRVTLRAFSRLLILASRPAARVFRARLVTITVAELD